MCDMTRRNTDVTRANAVRVRKLAEQAARDPVKLRRSLNVTRAALRLEVITLDDLTANDDSSEAAA